MSDTPRLSISCAPTFSNIDAVRSAVKGICSDYFGLACDAECVMDFCLIVSELMNNAVEHTDTGLLEVELLLTNQEAVFRLVSAGEGFDPTVATAMPENAPDRYDEGGYGLPLIQALANGMEYERRDNRNMVLLRKTFPPKFPKESSHGNET